MTVLAAQQLVKRYGNHAALDGFSMTLEPGRIVGLIGPNGSGKTTALKAIMGLTRLDDGELTVLGMDPYRDRPALMRQTSYIADVGILPRWMRINDLLQHVAAVDDAFDLDAARAALAKTDIKLQRRVRTLSKGMTVQLHLALVMATNAPLMVLDEPTLGLDLLYRRQFYDALLTDYLEDQRAIVITTHEVQEVAHILTDVVFIRRGRAVLAARMDELAKRFSKAVGGSDTLPELERHGPIALRRTLNGVEAIFDGLDPAQLPAAVELQVPSLSDLFVAVLGDQA